jgi:hypothetical protein
MTVLPGIASCSAEASDKDLALPSQASGESAFVQVLPGRLLGELVTGLRWHW